MIFRRRLLKASSRSTQPPINHRYTVNERGKSSGNATKNVNVLREYRAGKAAHNGLVAGSRIALIGAIATSRTSFRARFVVRYSGSHPYRTRDSGTARPPSDSYSALTESPRARPWSFSRLLFCARYRRVDGARDGHDAALRSEAVESRAPVRLTRNGHEEARCRHALPFPLAILRPAHGLQLCVPIWPPHTSTIAIQVSWHAG